jgi:hypothetical protein
MPHLQCLIDELPYDGIMYRKGDRFFATAEDARLLKGWAKACDDEVVETRSATRGMTVTRALRADQLDLAGPKQQRSGRYRRSDMRSEDS